MSRRHQSRELILKTLYNLDVLDDLKPYTDINYVIDTMNKIRVIDSVDSKDDLDYSKKILSAIIDRINTINDILTKAAPEWPLDKINIIDRNILRIGIYEIIFANDEGTPPKVAINEAIELAKEYSGQKSFSFVNGVMGTIYKEIFNNKELEQNQQKENKKEISFIECVPYSLDKNMLYLGFILDKNKKWCFPKSEEDKNKNIEENILNILNNKFDVIERINEYTKLTNKSITLSKREGEKIKENTTFYLIKMDYKIINSPNTDKSISAKWIKSNEIEKLNKQNDIEDIINKTLEKLSWNK